MTPAELGFRQPAEWSPHDAVWTAWPYLDDEWAEGVAAPRAELAALCRELARAEPVELFVREADAAAARELVGPDVRFHHAPYGDVWLRDTGPVFVVRGGELGALRFRWDGWGGKYLMPGDAGVSTYVAAHARARDFGFAYVLEGGAIDVDGEGTVLTTRQCLEAREPGAGEADLRDALGVTRVVWLGRGLQNDHTDGHVDTIARFVAPGVVAAMEPGDGDPNADAMHEILRDLDVAGLEIVAVPSPGAVLDARGTLMPASYCNFVIANGLVVVPTYGVHADDAAVARLAAAFPDRRVVGLSCRAVLVGGGGFHCCTQQQPRVP